MALKGQWSNGVIAMDVESQWKKDKPRKHEQSK